MSNGSRGFVAFMLGGVAVLMVIVGIALFHRGDLGGANTSGAKTSGSNTSTVTMDQPKVAK